MPVHVLCSASSSEVSAQWHRQEVSHGALVLPASGASDMTSCAAAAAIMLHLIQPDAFGVDIAAAACVALAVPLMEAAAVEPHSHDDSLTEGHRVHRMVALAHLGRLNAALKASQQQWQRSTQRHSQRWQQSASTAG